MTVRPIRLFCDPVLIGDPRATSLVQDLIDGVREPGRAGLAANQIGVGLRVFSFNVDDVVDYVINPEIVEVSGEPVLMDEGCLSVPGFYFPRLRYPFARVRGVDLEGNEIEFSGEGTMAQALQHEVDHLDGHLFIEELEPSVKKEAMRAIRAAPWY
jgi:peptide deformylase